MNFRIKKIIKGIEKRDKIKVPKSEETLRLKNNFFATFFKVRGI